MPGPAQRFSSDDVTTSICFIPQRKCFQGVERSRNVSGRARFRGREGREVDVERMVSAFFSMAFLCRGSVVEKWEGA